MNLLMFGNGVQRAEWKVEEGKPIGYCRVYYIAGGEVWYQDEHGKRELKRNCLYFFPSAKAYEIHHNPEKPIDCLWWHMDLFPTVVMELIEIKVDKAGGFFSLLEAIRLMLMENGGKTASFEVVVSAMVEYCFEQGWLPQPNGRIKEILAWLDVSYNQPGSIEEISRNFHYTPEHFIRLFQKETNLTPYQYLIQRRMREAGKLLMQDVPVKKVASLVGYQDAKVFAYRFKQVFQLAPSQYKKFYHPMA